MNRNPKQLKLTKIALAAAAAFGLACSAGAWAGDTATQSVTATVSAINEISITGGPVTLNVNSATAGSQPTDATNSATSYAITTNVTGPATKKITAQIDGNTVSGVTLKIALTSPGSGTPAAAQTLSTTPQSVLTAISAVAGSGTVTYTLSATVAAAIGSQTKIVTLTLADS